MSNKTELQSNNLDLQAILDTVNNLPENEGGGGDNEIIKSLLDNSITEFISDVTQIGSHAMRDKSKLRNVSLPKVTHIGEYAFYGSFESLSRPILYLPELTSINDYAFTDTGVITAILPKLKTVSSFAFRDCSVLEKVDLGAATAIKGAAFSNCQFLRTLIIRTNSVCSLAYTTVFNTTLIQGGTGYIYVPSALIEDYKNATNWSTYASQFRALEDYTVDGTITGELDESKI